MVVQVDQGRTGMSSNGRTVVFGTTYQGSSPCVPNFNVLQMNKYLRMASRVSIKGNWKRKAHIGVVALRKDGAVVQSYNGTATDVCPTAHGEARIASKLDVGSVVYVARVRRDNGKLAMAKPCPNCERVLRLRGVKRVEYTINEHEYGVIVF